MRRILQQHKNNGKALELRLEQYAPDSYCVILAGITSHLRGACISGVCEPTCEGEFMYLENETYKSLPFTSLPEAEQAYGILKGQCVEGVNAF